MALQSLAKPGAALAAVAPAVPVSPPQALAPSLFLPDSQTTVGLVLVAVLLALLIALNHRKKTVITTTLKALQETEARYRVLFEHSPIALMEMDLSTVKTFLDRIQAHGTGEYTQYFSQHPESLFRCASMARIVDANRAACALYGAATPDALGQLAVILPEDQGQRFKEELLALLTEKCSTTVLNNKTLLGDVITVDRRAVIASGYEQTWSKVIVTVLDITEQVQLRDKNKLFEKQLQQTQKLEAIGSLTGGIAHDFNNILAPILGRAELMLVENQDNTQLREHCHGIIAAAKRARDLVRQILTFSRQVEQEIQPVSLATAIREVINLLRPTVPSGIELFYDLPENDPLVMADATQLHQVIMNLVTNALHAMEEHGDRLGIELRTIHLGPDTLPDLRLSPGLYQQLRIQDNGHGMDQKTMAKIFDPYFTTKPRGKGTGLGLAVVLGILRGYGCEIRVDSGIGAGTTFTLYFPVVELAAPKSIAECLPQQAMPRGTEHILLVDDEKSIADVTTGMLERLGYKVTVRISSYDALEAFRNLADRIDLLIADLTMPQMTGLQLYREIRAIRPDIKVIICSGFSEQPDLNNSTSMGIQGFLHKPVVMSDLARCVRSVLDQNASSPPSRPSQTP